MTMRRGLLAVGMMNFSQAQKRACAKTNLGAGWRWQGLVASSQAEGLPLTVSCRQTGTEIHRQSKVFLLSFQTENPTVIKLYSWKTRFKIS